jgi:hypothetical protein
MALILKRAPIGWDQDDCEVLENGVIVGRIFFLAAVSPEGRHWMGRAAKRPHTPRGARLRADARGRDGGLRQELAAGESRTPVKECGPPCCDCSPTHAGLLVGKLRARSDVSARACGRQKLHYCWRPALEEIAL